MIKHTKINTILLLILALSYYLIRGKADKNPSSFKKVLAVYPSQNVGDIIFATPVFRALKRERPDIRLIVLGSGKNKEMLEFNPDVDEYIPFPTSTYSFWKLLRTLNVDYAFLFTTNSIELAVLYLANIPLISAFSVENASKQALVYSILKKMVKQIRFYSGQNFAVQNLRVLEPIGIHTSDPTKYLSHSPLGEKTAKEFLKEHGVDPKHDIVVAIAPGAGTKVKQWPTERFSILADHIAAKYKVPIFIVGGLGDKKEYEEMKKHLKDETVTISCHHQTIDELKAFMAQIDLIIANDSAPIYFGECFGKSTLTIVGPTDEREHPPTGEKHRVAMWANRGAPQLPSMEMIDYDERKALEQIEKVTVETVVRASDELLDKIQQDK